ncbi:MAG: hypothetical protein P1P88_02075 [Bacteroidales bacterium]|nr:hypothetical protein [Bacteroidales bacterium]
MKLKLSLLITLSFFWLYAAAQVQPRTAGQESNSQDKQYDFTDNKNGTSMMPMMGDVLPLIQYIEDTMKVEIVRIEYDLIFKDKSKYTYRFLHNGWKYGIFVVGDYRIKKINMNLFINENKEWKFLSSTNSESYVALLNVEPTEVKEYAIEIKADEFASDYKAGHYAIIIYH